jgi:hypothetical protein
MLLVGDVEFGITCRCLVDNDICWSTEQKVKRGLPNTKACNSCDSSADEQGGREVQSAHLFLTSVNNVEVLKSTI